MAVDTALGGLPNHWAVHCADDAALLRKLAAQCGVRGDRWVGQPVC